MARTPKVKPAPAPEPEETEEGGATRGPGEMHELFSEWLLEETGVTVTPEAIFLVTSKRTAFRKSEEYLAYAEKQDELREQKSAEKEERAKERAAKPVAAEEPEEKTARRRGKAKPDAEDTAEKEKVTPLRGRRRGKATEDTDGDEAQAEAAPAAKPTARRRRSAAPANF